MTSQDPSWVVLRFRGTPDADPAAWATFSEIARVRARGGEQPIVVHDGPQRAEDALSFVKTVEVAIGEVRAKVEAGLDRGGSDEAAARIAVALGVSLLEVWTGLPGMFTADPHVVPTARRLNRLSYNEAQEIVTTGDQALHPQCIPIVRDSGIAIRIRSLGEPTAAGTAISSRSGAGGPGLKAISMKKGVVLISMETVGMWQVVGFLARAFQCFQAHGLSVDLVATSETNVTVSLDARANTLDRTTLDGLVRDLSELAVVRVIEPCASVSLVGRGIRGLLPRLSPAFEVFDEERAHMVTQAANDLNLTFVVDEDQAPRLVKRLHHLFFSAGGGGADVGPTWDELRAGGPVPVRGSARVPDAFWVDRREELMALLDGRDAAYVYDLETIRSRARALRAIDSLDQVLYAMKANSHADVIRAAVTEGLGLECVSEGEIDHARASVGGDVPILFTPNFAPRSEYRDAFELGVHVTVDGLHPLRAWPEVFRGRPIFVRVDAGDGRGHHEKVRTVGPGAKFGVPLDDLPEVRAITDGIGATVVGLHVHSGSGILEPKHWERNAVALLAAADSFANVRYVDLGGGLGVPDRPGRPHLDLSMLGEGLASVRHTIGERQLWLEPGRFVVAEAGVLIARVTQVKRKGERHFVGIATGMNSLIRPMLYGAHHDIVNLTRLDAPPTRLTTVVGPICETGDRLGVDRLLPPTEEGDVILIDQAGAYGRVMASSYNMRPPAEELVI